MVVGVDRRVVLMDQRSYFILQNTRQLKDGIEVLSRLDDRTYAECNHRFFASGIGKHIRHILDMYQCFLMFEDGSIDYDDRERDTRLETDREYAIEKARELIDRLESLRNSAVVESLSVSSNEGPNTAGISPWCSSSLVRELQYLASHTVHHYAIIAMILRILGHGCPEHFGVAPSTILYEQSR